MKNFTKLLFIILITLFFQTESFSQSWSSKASLPANELQGAVAFTIAGKGYIVTGTTFSGSGSDKLWEYDPILDTWTSKSNFPGSARTYAVAFSIGNKGYVGTGYSSPGGSSLNDFWEWDQSNNTWTQKTNFPGTARRFACGFSIDSLGYIGGGWDNSGISGTIKGDFWQYSPATDTWTSRANLPTARYGSTGFTIGNKGYASGGDIGSGVNFYTDLLEYNPVLNTWTAKASLPSTNGEAGRGRNLAFAFTIGNKGYIGTGVYIPAAGGLPAYCSDFWEWDQATDTWTMKASFPGGNRQWTVGFGIGNFGYAGTGERAGASYNDIWEYGTGSTGIESKFISNQISLFPDPNNGIFSLQFPSGYQLVDLKIVNSMGKIVYHGNTTDNYRVVDLSELSNGLYFVIASKDHVNNLLRKFTISK